MRGGERSSPDVRSLQAFVTIGRCLLAHLPRLHRQLVAPVRDHAVDVHLDGPPARRDRTPHEPGRRGAGPDVDRAGGARSDARLPGTRAGRRARASRGCAAAPRPGRTRGRRRAPARPRAPRTRAAGSSSNRSAPAARRREAAPRVSPAASRCAPRRRGRPRPRAPPGRRRRRGERASRKRSPGAPAPRTARSARP